MRAENKHIMPVSGPWPRLIRLTALQVTDISMTRCVNIREEDILCVGVRMVKSYAFKMFGACIQRPEPLIISSLHTYRGVCDKLQLAVLKNDLQLLTISLLLLTTI